MFIQTAAAYGAALLLSFKGGSSHVAEAAGVAGASVKANPIAESSEGGFLRDVVITAEENGLIASDKEVAVASSGVVQLSDEEILANNPGLARFFEMLEDDEKYAKWEKDEMPQLLVEIQTNANSGRQRQKKWARKAIIKSEIEACWVQKNGKGAAYWAWCSRWQRVWFVNICTGHSCNSGDNLVWPLCHRGCNGWKDDGSYCYKPCQEQSTAPTQCGHMMCAADTGACVGAIVNMVVSIVSMLASIFPAGKVAALATKMAQAATKAAMKALLKQFAKEIGKQLLKKAKKKVKKFIKSEIKGAIRGLRDEAVEAILQEAAEAFAIERTSKEVGYQVPSWEEVARAVDPIGVADVIDAFNLKSCTDTELEDFPACADTTRRFHSDNEIDAMLQAEDNCCFGYTLPATYYVWGFGYRQVCNCLDGSHVSASLGSTQVNTTDTTPDWLSTNDDIVDESIFDEAVDVLYENLPLTGEALMFCELCVQHNVCDDNKVEGANMTLFDKCTAEQCCSPPEGFVPSGNDEGPDYEIDISPPMIGRENFNLRSLGASLSSSSESPDQNDCAACDAYSMCTSPGTAYELCSSKGCCEGMEDPSSDDYLPPPIESNTTTATDDAEPPTN